MGIIFDYKDPFFSLLVVVSLIFLIALISYARNIFKMNENEKSVTKFLGQFTVDFNKNEIKNLFETEKLSKKIVYKIAQSYYINAEYEEAIKIYMKLLSLYKNSDKDRAKILLLLAKTYYKVSMFERSKVTLLEFFELNPVNIESLRMLLSIYEKNRSYNKALELLEPMDEIGHDSTKEYAYFNFLKIIDSNDSNEHICSKVLKIYNDNNFLFRNTFKYIFKVNPKEAWQNIDLSKAEIIIDVLWMLKKEDIDFEIVKRSSLLKEIFSAKGYINSTISSSILELDILLNLNRTNCGNVDLSFDYTCGHCRYVLPFEVNRCPKCNTIDEIKPNLKLVRNNFEESYNI